MYCHSEQGCLNFSQVDETCQENFNSTLHILCDVGLSCKDGICTYVFETTPTSVPNCDHDADCQWHEFCHGREGCISFRQENETCNIGLHPDYHSQCVPGLDCEALPNSILGANGICKPSSDCQEDIDCTMDKFCFMKDSMCTPFSAEGDVCDEDSDDADAHILCDMDLRCSDGICVGITTTTEATIIDCAIDADCEWHQFCHGRDGCIAYRQENEECNVGLNPNYHYECEPGLDCEALKDAGRYGANGICKPVDLCTSDIDCPLEKFCLIQNGTCMAFQNEGEFCDEDSEDVNTHILCGSDYICENNICNSEPITTTSKIKDCSVDANCKWNEFCHGRDGCIPYRLENEECNVGLNPDYQYECLPGLDCEAKAQPDSITGKVYEGTHIRTDGVCKPTRICEADIDCTIDKFCYVANNTCMAFKLEGELCDEQNENATKRILCDLSLICRDGVCFAESDTTAPAIIDCADDVDCKWNQYCHASKGCIQYSAIDEECNVSLSPEYQLQCEPGLDCNAVPNSAPGQNGVCKPTFWCQGDNDCSEDKFCYARNETCVKFREYNEACSEDGEAEEDYILCALDLTCIDGACAYEFTDAETSFIDCAKDEDCGSERFCQMQDGCIPYRFGGESCNEGPDPEKQYLCADGHACEQGSCRLNCTSDADCKKGYCDETHGCIASDCKVGRCPAGQFCHGVDGCTNFRDVGEKCIASIHPNFHYRCKPGLDCKKVVVYGHHSRLGAYGTCQIPSNETIFIETLKFKGNYSYIVGNRKEKFLHECYQTVQPVMCVDAYPGSIMIEMKGTWDQLKTMRSHLEVKGLTLPSFPKLIYQDPGEDLSDESFPWFIAILASAPCGIFIGVIYFWKNQEKTKSHDIALIKRSPENSGDYQRL